MFSSSTSARQTSPDLLAQDLNLQAGETRDFDINGRILTLHGTGTDVTVISSQGNAVVLRRQPDGRFTVTGASTSQNASRPLGREDAVALAVQRLDR